MLERLKDFLYDISDIAVSLLIIAVIFFSVSWKISDTLNVDMTLLPGSTDTELTTPSDGETNTDPAGDGDTETVIEIIPDINTGSNDAASETNTETSAGTSSIETNTTTPATSTSTPSTSTSAPATSTTPLVLETFVVSQGQSGYGIGQNLASQGYVDSANAFVSRLVERNLDRKLFAGDFKLSKSDNLDTIINVLTGQGR